MNKRLTELLKDFLGEHNCLGEFTASIHKGEYWIMLDNEPVCKFSEDYDERVTNSVMGAKKINQWKSEVESAAHDFIASIAESGFEIAESWAMDEPYETQYMGSVFTVTPSGKYYMPWANSNVNIIEAAKDSMFYEIVERELDKLGYWLESGEGDPCDLFVSRSIE